MKNEINRPQEFNEMLKARFDMLSKLDNSQKKLKMSRYKQASSNKSITFVNVK